MKIAKIKSLMKKYNVTELEWSGQCHDCDCDVSILAKQTDEEIEISGGAIYEIEQTQDKTIFLKCEDCFTKNKTLTNFRQTEVYSRVVGYLRPVSQWNGAKRTEFKLRTPFNLNQDIIPNVA